MLSHFLVCRMLLMVTWWMDWDWFLVKAMYTYCSVTNCILMSCNSFCIFHFVQCCSIFSCVVNVTDDGIKCMYVHSPIILCHIASENTAAWCAGIESVVYRRTTCSRTMQTWCKMHIMSACFSAWQRENLLCSINPSETVDSHGTQTGPT